MLLVVLMISFMQSRNIQLNVSALQATGNLGIYSDAQAKTKVSSINWGTLTAGGQPGKSVIYVRNEANASTILFLSTANWNPTNASKYLTFSWSTQNATLKPGDIVMVTQYLSVSSNTKGITTFSFDIIFEGRAFYLGDINKDGQVDLIDTVLMGLAFNSTPANPNWNPQCDLNKDGAVDILDLVMVALNFGKG